MASILSENYLKERTSLDNSGDIIAKLMSKTSFKREQKQNIKNQSLQDAPEQTSALPQVELSTCPICDGRGIVLQGDSAIACSCMEQKRIDNSFKYARMSKELQTYSFAQFNLEYYRNSTEPDHYVNAQKALKAAQDFTEKVQTNPYEIGLLLSGPVGSGKTFLAACIANVLLVKQYKVLFLVVPDLLDELRASFSAKSETSEADLLDIARTVPILILDDLGAHNYTEWSRNRIYSILNYRMNEQLPTIITTNLNFDEIEQHLGERTCSRLLQMCRVFRLTAPQDIRRQKYIQREKGKGQL
jgi:DNA replication protein DnaC